MKNFLSTARNERLPACLSSYLSIYLL